MSEAAAATDKTNSLGFLLLDDTRSCSNNGTQAHRDQLAKRFTKDGKPDLYAKTGTINHVSALAGCLAYPDAGPNNTARV